MWKRFPRAPAAAPVLISRSDFSLEKLSSGRQAAGWDGGEANRGGHTAVRAQYPRSTKAEKTRRLTQDGEVRLQPRGLTEPGTVSSCDGANSSFGEEIKIRWVQRRVKWAAGICLPKPCSGSDLEPKVREWCKARKTTQRNTCATVPPGSWRCPPIAPGSTAQGIVFQRKYLRLKKLFQYVSSRSGSFPPRLRKKQRMGVLCAASRGQGQTIRTPVSLHSWRDTQIPGRLRRPVLLGHSPLLCFNLQPLKSDKDTPSYFCSLCE